MRREELAHFDCQWSAGLGFNLIYIDRVPFLLLFFYCSAAPIARSPQVRGVVSVVRRIGSVVGRHVPRRLLPDTQLHQLGRLLRNDAHLRSRHFGKRVCEKEEEGGEWIVIWVNGIAYLESA